MVEERRHYGPVGWNIQYEFNVSDLVVSAKVNIVCCKLSGLRNVAVKRFKDPVLG